MELNPMEPDRDMNDAERKFSQGARQALRQSERALDAPTAARLRAARAQAVAAADTPRFAWGWMMPAGAVAAALLVFALLPAPAPVGDPVPAQLASDEAVELLTDDVGPDFLQNLDLYEWLDDDGESA